jgi:urea transport system permease protein
MLWPSQLIKSLLHVFLLSGFLLLTVSAATCAIAESDSSLAAPEKAIGSASPALEALVCSLPDKKLRDLSNSVTELPALGDETILPLLKALLEGDLYYRKDNRQVVSAKKQADSKDYQLFDYTTLASLDSVEKKAIRKVRKNNKLRSQLRTVIARLNLFSKQVPIRKSVVAEITENLNPDNIALLEAVKSKKIALFCKR